MDEDNAVIPANNVSFEDLCQVFEKLFNLNNSTAKTRRDEQDNALHHFINNFRMNAATISCKKNCTFFPILRLLLPDLERERGAYNIKESKLGRLLVKVLSLHENSPDAKKLLNFRSVMNSDHGSDFANVAYFVMKNMVKGSGNITIKDVNDALDNISNAEVGNKSKIFDEIFTNIIRSTTDKQRKWFIRILLKNLRIGMGHKRILAAFHPDAPEHYENLGNIFKVCEELDDGNTRPPELGIQLFSAVSPMLSEKLDIMSIEKLPEKRTYQIENKFDGERFQMHMKNGVFEYFSRRGFSYSDQYGKTYDSDGLLTPFLKDCFKADVNNFILDGEMMGWHKKNNCFGSKGMAFDVKKITRNSSFQPCFCVFDLLYYNGKSLVGALDKGGVPLCDRLKLLDALFEDIPGVIYHSKREFVKTRLDIVEALNRAIINGDEGIVVKEIDSHYLVNRRNAGWYKIKPEYTEGAMVDLDLVIIGGNYAENKKQGFVNSFLVAVADRVASEEWPHRWLSLGRVAIGLSYNERESICKLLEPHWRRYDKVPAPQTLVFAKEKPELWVDPKDSIVLEVRASELIRSRDFATPYTLRFPRVVKVRDDKPVKDALTLDELNDLVKDRTAVQKLVAGQVDPDAVAAGAAGAAGAARARRKRQARPLQAADQFKAAAAPAPAPRSPPSPPSRALLSRKLCVLSDDEDCRKHELETLIRSHGGIVVQNIGADTWCCVAGRRTVRVMNALDSVKCDVVSSRWLRALAAAAGPCAPPAPRALLACTRRTRAALARRYDVYGDHYTERADEHTIESCFDKMESFKEPKLYLTTEEIIELEKELFDGFSPYSFLRGCFICFPDRKHRLAIKASMYGGTICDFKSPNLTHVIVKQSDVERSNKRIVDTIEGVHYVFDSWLEACFLNKRRVPEADFVR